MVRINASSFHAFCWFPDFFSWGLGSGFFYHPGASWHDFSFLVVLADGLWTIQFRHRALSVRFVVDECVDMGYRLGSCWGLLALLLLALTALEVGRLSAGPTPPSGEER